MPIEYAFPSHNVHREDQPGVPLLDWLAAHENLSDLYLPDQWLAIEVAEALAGYPRPEAGWQKAPVECAVWEAKWRARLKYIRAQAMMEVRADLVLPPVP